MPFKSLVPRDPISLHVLSTHLQHLNEGNTQVEVCLISANQAQAEEETDWENSAEVDLAGHFDGFASIKEGRGLR